PPPLITERDEICAIRLHADGGNPTELLEIGGEHHPAAEFEEAELPVRRIAIVKTRERLRAHRDLHGRGDTPRALRRNCERCHRSSRPQRPDGPCGPPKPPPARRGGGE